MQSHSSRKISGETHAIISAMTAPSTAPANVPRPGIIPVPITAPIAAPIIAGPPTAKTEEIPSSN